MQNRSYDVLVIGGGIAGLTAALAAARKWDVALITKKSLDDTTTFFAQGGIAAALGPYDSPDLHFEDTVAAGAGLCDEEAVRVLVDEGPARVSDLERLGTQFDKRDGHIVLGSEGAHSVPRVVHAGGDATGSVVASALAEAMVVGSRVELHEDELVLDLVVEGERCLGAVSLSKQGELRVSFARAVILAAGGAGQVFSSTTNPLVATGDGHAMGYRAGAVLEDMEFMQFHPTALHSDENPTLLVTEALRGEGAYLRDTSGERFMLGTDPRAELAPRDVVVRRMETVMRKGGADHVLLDARHLPCPFLHTRFPTVSEGLKRRGYDLCDDLIPVAPASHYFIGGVATNTWGRTSLRGLYSCGENAATGVHGANRLASNSLLEGLVFGDRIVRDLDKFLCQPVPAFPGYDLALAARNRQGNDEATVKEVRLRLGSLMHRFCGTVKSRDHLERAEAEIGELRATLAPPALTEAEIELQNLLTVADLMVRSSLVREESRGVHLRSDFPERDDLHWKKHVAVVHDRESGEARTKVLAPEERGLIAR